MERISISVNGQQFQDWNEFTLQRAIDGIDTFSLSSTFEPSSLEHRKFFEPFQYQEVTAKIDGELVLTGTVINTQPESSPDSDTVTMSGYSRPGSLGDCDIPPGFPREFKKQRLPDILHTIAVGYLLEVDYQLNPGAPFDRVAIDPDQAPLSPLSELAKQRGGVLSSTPTGALRCWRSAAPSTSVPVATLDGSPLVKVSTSGFDGQTYFSSLTGWSPRRKGSPGGVHTVQNPLFAGEVRHKNFKLDDIAVGDLLGATDAKLARMFGNSATFTVEDLPSLRTPTGALWSPNQTISLRAPGAMIYDFNEFLIRAVDVRAVADSATASLQLVLPGSFSGDAPGYRPWRA